MKVEDCTLLRPLKCSETENIVEVAKILRKEKQRRVIVVDENEFPFGIISTTDISNRVVAENKEPSKLKAADIMTSPIFLICDLGDDLEGIFTRMVEQKSYFCPVVKEKKLYGIITYGELIKHVQSKNGNS
jgi:signal-transduction protein with cAMP-binding, CBS, and nucleotidyltransferase domain